MTFQYDEAGNRKQRTDYNGLVTKYFYDKADNLEKIAAINSFDNVTEFDVATYGYDQLNRLLTATNSAGTVTFAYDNRGRMQSETNVFGKVLSYGYTENSTTNRKTVTFEGSLYSTYDFDDANRLTQITDNTSGVYSFAYDNVNRMISRTLPNGVVTTTDYDGLGRMKFWKNVNASSTVLNEYQYGYNTANQITSITEPSRTRNFGYDNSDRLTSTTSTVSGQNENYSFDSVGNRTSSHLSSSYGYQQGSFNRLTTTQQASYSFDSNGNVTSKSEGNDKWYYFYDRENRLVNATKFGGMMPRAGQSVSYSYDALGRRVSRQDKKTGRTEFTHDGLDVIQDRFEKSDGTNSTTSYINGLGIDDKLKLSNGTTSKYFLTDHLGSTTGLTDSNGAVTESASYDSFGNKTGSLSTRYGYTGRETDEATGLMYYRARFYDPLIGRFTSEDPIGFAGGDVNLYGYVGNNPIRHTDPSGLQFRSDSMDDYRKIKRKNDLYDQQHPGWREAAAEAAAMALQRRHEAIEKPCSCPDANINANNLAVAISGDSNNPFIKDANGNLVSTPGGPSINPNGQSFIQVRDKIENLGFSWYPNFESAHIGGDDYRGQMPTGEWFHITIGRPGNGIFWDPIRESPPWVTIHCHGTDPLGQIHINDHLARHGWPQIVPGWWPWY